jgi:uncharacterized protein YndB with AHSA1/START domain
MNNPVPSSELRVVLTRVFNAPCPLVYQAWTEPTQMLKWWGPKDIECRDIQAEVKVGGAYRIHLTSEKGDHIAIGKYLQVVPNKRLQFTWQWEHYAMPDSTVTVDFEDLGKTTRLTLTHAGLPDQEDVTDHTRGWTSLLEKFASMTESGQIKF